jgi:hypothetical protein
MEKATMVQMVAAVKAHAVAHYEEGGWDSIVECYDDEDLQAEIEASGATTVAAAIEAIGWGAGLYNEIRQDVLAEVF